MNREMRLYYNRLAGIRLGRENVLDQLETRQIKSMIRRGNALFDQYSEFLETIPLSDEPSRKQVLEDINLIESVIEKLEDYVISRYSGGGFWKRDTGKFPPKMRKNLDMFGDEKIETLTVFRVPMPEVKFLVKLFSGGRVPYDTIWHLGIKINNKYYLDKDAVWTFKKLPLPSEKKLESIVVSGFKKGVSIKQWLEQTAQRVGVERFYKYTAFKNNCQRAMMDLLATIGVNERQYKDFVLQDANLIKSKLPSWSEGMADLFNSAKEIVNRRIEGEGFEYLGYGVGSSKVAPIDDVELRRNYMNILTSDRGLLLAQIRTIGDIRRRIRRDIPEISNDVQIDLFLTEQVNILRALSREIIEAFTTSNVSTERLGNLVDSIQTTINGINNAIRNNLGRLIEEALQEVERRRRALAEEEERIRREEEGRPLNFIPANQRIKDEEEEFQGQGNIYDFLFLDKEKIRRARERQGFTKMKGKGVDEPKILF